MWLKRDFKCNFEWLYMERWQCLIHQGTLESFVWSSSFKFNFFCFFKLFIFICGFSAKVSGFLANEKHLRNKRNKHFLSKKTTIFFQVSDQIKLSFQGYHCKSDFAIFAWKVTWSYACNSLNKIKKTFVKKNVTFVEKMWHLSKKCDICQKKCDICRKNVTFVEKIWHLLKNAAIIVNIMNLFGKCISNLYQWAAGKLKNPILEPTSEN